MARMNETTELEVPMMWQNKHDARAKSLKCSSADIDDWDFMEFSEIAQILKSEDAAVDVDVTEPFFKSVHQTSLLPARQIVSKSTSGSRSTLPVEDPKSSSTAPQGSIGPVVNQEELSGMISIGNSVEPTNVNHSKSMKVSSSHPNSSGEKLGGTLVQSSQGWIVWSSTPHTTQAQMAGTFVQNKNSNQSMPNSTSSSKLIEDHIRTSGSFVQFLTDSMAQKPSLLPTSSEPNFSGSALHRSDEKQMVQSLTILPSSSAEDVSGMLHELSDMRQLRKQYPRSFPSTSSEAKTTGTAGDYVELLNLNQSMIQSPTPWQFPPSSRREWEMPINEQLFHETNDNRPFVQCTDTMDINSSSPFLLPSKRKANIVVSDYISSPNFGQPSNVSQVMAQNQTPSFISYPSVNKGFLVGNENLSAIPNVNFVSPANMNKFMEDSVATATRVQGEPKISIKCRTRSKPGCSTNPRSLTEKTRRQRINERFKELQKLIPNSVKADNMVDMLDQAITYVEHLEKQLKVLIMEKGEHRDIDLSSFFQGNDDEREQANRGTLERGKRCHSGEGSMLRVDKP